eukprot:scaffold39650_cov32-Prasinocladus_malaysianus.AAC.1
MDACQVSSQGLCELLGVHQKAKRDSFGAEVIEACLVVLLDQEENEHCRSDRPHGDQLSRAVLRCELLIAPAHEADYQQQVAMEPYARAVVAAGHGSQAGKQPSFRDAVKLVDFPVCFRRRSG